MAVILSDPMGFVVFWSAVLATMIALVTLKRIPNGVERMIEILESKCGSP